MCETHELRSEKIYSTFRLLHIFLNSIKYCIGLLIIFIRWYKINPFAIRRYVIIFIQPASCLYSPWWCRYYSSALIKLQLCNILLLHLTLTCTQAFKLNSLYQNTNSPWKWNGMLSIFLRNVQIKCLALHSQ